MTCCVCGGAHHPMQCERARRYIAECTNTRISPAPRSPVPWWNPVRGLFEIEITTATRFDNRDWGRQKA